MDLTNTPLASREWRLSNLYTIRDAHGSLRPFTPNIAQREFYNRLWYCNHVLKARKLGFSTFIEILFLDDLLFLGPLRAGIIDYTIEDAQTKLGMMRLAYHHLDDPEVHPHTHHLGQIIKTAIPLTRSSERSLEFGNGSNVRISTSLRGETPQRIHISELGKTSIWAPIKAREIINGAFNSIVPGSVRNIETTHEGGKLGENYRLMQAAMRHNDSQLSNIQSRFHFFPWFKDPRYRIETPGTIRPEIKKYFQSLHTNHAIQVDPQQALWYDHKHLEQGHGMKKEFPSTPGEAFEAIVEGSIYGNQIADLRAQGRVIPFAPEAHLPLFTFWDIGLSDYTSLWLIQQAPRNFLVLDWFEAEGLPGSAMPDAILALEARYRRKIHTHFLPHDADTRDRGTGKSYVQTLHEAGLTNTRVVPRTPDVWLGIGYARDVLPHCWFNAPRVDSPRTRDGRLHQPDSSEEEFPSGLACLEGYSRDVSAAASGQSLREKPKHDLFSHTADAFRTFAEAHRRNLINAAIDTHHNTKPRAIR